MRRKSTCEKFNDKLQTLVKYLAFCSIFSGSKAECEPPSGSYLQTCLVYGSRYFSSDPNLRDITLCKFDFSCKKLDGDYRQNTLYSEQSMVGCLEYIENCNGYGVFRKQNERVCTTLDTIYSEADKARYKLEL